MNTAPKFEVGHILVVCDAQPPFVRGDRVAVLEIKPATWDVRYRVEKVKTKEQGWVSEKHLIAPMEIWL